jgi:hypothetical protein
MRYIWLILWFTLTAITLHAQSVTNSFILSGAPASAPSTQALRPNSDIYTGGWNTTGTNYYDQINEVVANDATNVSTDSNGGDNELIVGLSAGSTPSVKTGHILHVRSMLTGGCGSELLVDIYCGATFVIEVDWDLTDTEPTDRTYTLNTDEANLITDYSALELHFIGVNLGCDEFYRVYQAWLEIPSP